MRGSLTCFHGPFAVRLTPVTDVSSAVSSADPSFFSFETVHDVTDENLVVKKMGLFATVFTRADGTETYYFNSQLFNMFM
jgi:hypothetical protein